MAILSRFMATARPMLRAATSSGRSSIGGGAVVQKQAVRAHGDHREMNIRSSNWAFKKARDEWLFYLLLTGIPVTIFIHLVNIFIGPAELAETPEGYEPEYYEYYKHPITRWMCRYMSSGPQKEYEKMMHHLQEQYEQMELRRVAHKVDELQQIRGDYQAGFYIPTDAENYALTKIYEQENMREAYGRVS